MITNDAINPFFLIGPWSQWMNYEYNFQINMPALMATGSQRLAKYIY